MMVYLRQLTALSICAGLLISCQSSGQHIDPDKQNKRAKIHYQIGLTYEIQ